MNIFTDLFLSILASHGLYQIVGRSSIMASVRHRVANLPRVGAPLHELITCALCSGYWYGTAIAALYLFPHHGWIVAMLGSYAIAGATLGMTHAVDALDRIASHPMPVAVRDLSASIQFHDDLSGPTDSEDTR